MDYIQLNKDIRNRKFSSVYLFEAIDGYMADSMLAQLKKALISPEYEDFNYSVFSEKKINLNSVTDLSDTQPFFDDNRLIVIKGDAVKNRTFQKSVREYLARLPEYSHFVFYADGRMDKRTALYKFIKKNGCTVEFDRFSEYKLGNWIKRKLGSQGIRITPGALNSFIEASGYTLRDSRTDLGYFIGEIEKLRSLEKSELNEEDIKRTVSVNVEDNIFKLTDALNDRNASRAFSLYHDLLYHNVNFVQILSVVSGNLERMFICMNYRKNRRSETDVVRDYSMHSYAVQMAMANSRKYTYPELKAALRLCFRLDKSYKSGEISAENAGVVLIEKIANRRRS